ncbi:hypothetical protein [Brevibacterium atlanticum]|uniref:hypothetical protein n=1 Tax=Brevibacterium atlanticum TaxID=2697563 RepID=UPI00141F1EBE|nr:hypothetical protein [Brevibacterium atlanticum]
MRLMAARECSDTLLYSNAEWYRERVLSRLNRAEREPERMKALIAIAAHRTVFDGHSYEMVAERSLDDLIEDFVQGQAAGEMWEVDSKLMARVLRRSLDAEAPRIAAGAPCGPTAEELVTSFSRAESQ